MELISWESLEDYIERGIAAQLPISIGSAICFLIGNEGESLGLRLDVETAEKIRPSPYEELEIDLKLVNEKLVIELVVAQDSLFRTFYHFAIDIVQQVLLHGASSEDAILRALESWTQLLSRRKLLEGTEQTGLIGELCLLQALIKKQGHEGFYSWVGPVREPHDFRLGEIEIEVKSTTQLNRVHRIHGLDQLEPSPGIQLYLLSLQFEPAGNAKGGKSLVDRIREIRQLLAEHVELLNTFESHLKNLGFDDADSIFYTAKLIFRGPPIIIPVDASFPKLTRQMVGQILTPGAAQRVSYVEYDLNVDGLGYVEGSPQFNSVMNGVASLEACHE